MPKAIFEVVFTDYFKNIQTIFKFLVTEKVPNSTNFKNYAIESLFKSEYCPFSVENKKKSHSHILIQLDSKEQLNHFFLAKNISVFVAFSLAANTGFSC